MLRQLRSAVIAVLILCILLGLAYPLAITGLAQLLFAHQANGSLIEDHRRAVGSTLIAQDFAGQERYFQSRPSASGYDPSRTAASNLGPSSRRLSKQIKDRLDAYLRRERAYDPGLSATAVPPDAITASGSGVDPGISVANARIQAHRVAAVRRLPLVYVDGLIAKHIESSAGGLFGEEAVNVLALNLALDRGRRR